MKSLFGYGITTKELAKEGEWQIFDDSFKDVSYDKYGNVLLPSSQFEPKKSKLEITSPGIPPSHSLIKKAKNLVSEFDYIIPQTTALQIWVTGTNGKTTTTQMIHHLVGGEIGGNIGIPLAKLNKNAKFWTIEASSFQLHYTKIAKPNIFVVLPIKEDHTSWHGSFEKYVDAKLSPLKRMNERDLVIMPKEFERETKAYKILYKNEKDLIEKFNFKELYFKTPFLLDEVLAKAVYYILFFKEKSLKNFQIDPHKLEEIEDKKGRIWIDDSKATNVDATLNALKRYKNRKIFLILGGVDKGQNFNQLFKFMQNLDIKIFIIGEETTIFEEMAKKYKIEYEVSHTLEKAVKKIDKIHSKNSVAILSPSCASFDQFSGYKERGEVFKSLLLQ